MSKLPHLLDAVSKFELFLVSGLKDEKLINSKPTWKCKLEPWVFWIFLQNFIKIDTYNCEIYRFQVGAFFETQCSIVCRWQHVFFHQEDQLSPTDKSSRLHWRLSTWVMCSWTI